MTTITLDHKLFDYSNIDEPLIAVPKSYLKDLIKNMNKSDTGMRLTEKDILRSREIAKREYKNGTLITL